jgi:PAS domain S-box-containing protein
MGAEEHFVQFYEDDAYLIASVSQYIASALKNDAAGIVIATRAHLEELERNWQTQGLDVSGARARGQYVGLDAAEVLAKLMIGERPDEQRFAAVVGSVIAQASARYPRVFAFGEMVTLLCQEQRPAAAVQLESLWNALGKRYTFSLYCAYPVRGFGQGAQATHFAGVCLEHSRVIPAESYSGKANADERLRVICELQQKAALLEQEVAERRAAEHDLADFLDNALEGMHKVGPDGRILWANRAELALLGYSPDEYIGHKISEFHVDAHVIDDVLKRLLAGEAIYDQPARLRGKDGSIKHVLIHSNGRWEDGKFRHTRCLTRDVTERKRLEVELQRKYAQLAEAERLKDEFLAMLGHELRNPLAPIRNVTEVLRRRNGADAADQQMYGMLARQVQHMARLLDDLLDVGRITQGKIQLQKEPLDLMAVIARAIETSRPLIESRRHRLSVALPEATVRLRGDLTRLVQMLANLLNNAAKYTPEGGKVVLTAQHRDDMVRLEVNDNGSGIAPAILPRVFDLFAQADRTLERSEGGLGIGLTLVRRIAEMHGGHVDAFSEGVGRGSTFVVHLPVIQESEDGSEAASTAPLSLPVPARRILLVEDNQDAAESLAALLQLSGHEVTIALNGISAIEIARALRPEVILLDIGLPELDGYQVARRLRDERCTAPLVALTGYGLPEDRQRSRLAGFDHHLVKPVDPGALDAVLREVRA